MENNVKSLTAFLVTTLLLGGGLMFADGVGDAYATSHNYQWEFLDIPSTPLQMTEGDSFTLDIIDTYEVGPIIWTPSKVWSGVSYDTKPYSEEITWAIVSRDNGVATLTATNIPSGTYSFGVIGDSDGGPLLDAVTIIVTALPPLLEISYTAPSGNAIANTNWTYTPTTVSGVTLTVTGASWLSVSGNMIYGVPPAAGTYDITVKMVKSGYADRTEMFTFTVVSALTVLNSPSLGAIIFLS